MRKPTPSVSAADTFFRYMPVSEAMRKWGFYVSSVGHAKVPPGVSYPPAKHPDDHQFSWVRGRTLASPQFVYITSGSGEFESAPNGRAAVREGSMLILYPGVWHRYRPDPSVGWHEYWMEIGGPGARAFLDRKEFSPDRPVLEVGCHDVLVQLYQDLLEAARHELYGFELLMSGTALQILGRILALCGPVRQQDSFARNVVAQARCILVEESRGKTDMPALARRLKVSYTWFRRTFKEHTGFSPGQYQLDHRMRRASQLLTSTDDRIGDIAEELAFESIYSFSKQFHKKMGCSPRNYRKMYGKSMQ